jgi:CRISPR system Cascade subunit CasE
MSPLYFSRARLSPHASRADVVKRLWHARGGQAATDHRLVWSLFPGEPEAERDFLWRRDEGGVFYLLSARVPEDPTGAFAIDTQSFAPVLSPGDVLSFQLAANPVVTRNDKRHDVVMDALKPLSTQTKVGDMAVSERARQRRPLAQERGEAWLARQGEKAGFALKACSVESYRPMDLPRKGGATARITRMDFRGLLQVEDPDAFLTRLARGFGKAKAFGLGLMLIRRA